MTQQAQNHRVIFHAISCRRRTIVQRNPLSLRNRDPIVFMGVLFEGILLDVVLLLGELFQMFRVRPMRVLVGELGRDMPLFVAGVVLGLLFGRTDRVAGLADAPLAAARVVVRVLRATGRFCQPLDLVFPHDAH